jgi:hypothetical protein
MLCNYAGSRLIVRLMVTMHPLQLTSGQACKQAVIQLFNRLSSAKFASNFWLKFIIGFINIKRATNMAARMIP